MRLSEHGVRSALPPQIGNASTGVAVARRAACSLPRFFKWLQKQPPLRLATKANVAAGELEKLVVNTLPTICFDESHLLGPELIRHLVCKIEEFRQAVVATTARLATAERVAAQTN